MDSFTWADLLVSLGSVVAAMVALSTLPHLFAGRFKRISSDMVEEWISEHFQRVEQKRAASPNNEPAVLRVLWSSDSFPTLGWMLNEFQRIHYLIRGLDGPRPDLKIMVGPLEPDLAPHAKTLIEIMNDPAGEHLKFFERKPEKLFAVVNDEWVIVIDKKNRARIAHNPIRAGSYKDFFDREWTGLVPAKERWDQSKLKI